MSLVEVRLSTEDEVNPCGVGRGERRGFDGGPTSGGAAAARLDAADGR